jgi:hypothetical protein
MAVRSRLTKPVRRPRVAVATVEASEAEVAAVAGPAEVVVAAAAVEAVVEAAVVAEAVAAMVAATGTAEIAGVSNGDSPALVTHSHLRLLRRTLPDLRLGDEFNFHFHIPRQA